MNSRNCGLRIANCELTVRGMTFAGRKSRLFLRSCDLCIILVVLAIFAACDRIRDRRESREDFWWPEQILSLEERQQETAEKIARVEALLKREQLAGLLITSTPNFSWLTAGGENPAPLFIRPDGARFLFAGASEGARLQAEDLKGMGFELREVPWPANPSDVRARESFLQNLAEGRPVGADSVYPGAKLLEGELADLRLPLTAAETKEYRWLGQRCAEAVESVCRRVQPGATERGIESLLSDALLRHAIRPALIRVACDERIRKFGAAPPNDDKKLDQTLLVSVCGRRWGLHVSLTRIVHFGPVPEDTKRAAAAAARVNAGFWARTLPGAKAGAIILGAFSDYSEAGFAAEWSKAEQGGAIGYLATEWIATPDLIRTVFPGQTFAWRPSVQGIRIEDTILINGETLEILSRTPDWPVIESRALGRIYRSPGILVR